MKHIIKYPLIFHMALTVPNPDTENQEMSPSIRAHKMVIAYINAQVYDKSMRPGASQPRMKKSIWKVFCKMPHDVFFSKTPEEIGKEYDSLEEYLNRTAQRAQDVYGRAGKMLIAFLGENFTHKVNPKEKSFHDLEVEKYVSWAQGAVQFTLKETGLSGPGLDTQKAWDELRDTPTSELQQKARDIVEQHKIKAGIVDAA